MIDKFGKQYLSFNAFPTHFVDRHRTLLTVEGKEREKYGFVIPRVLKNLSILSMIK